MSSRNSGGGEELYQSSLFRYTKPNPRNSAPAVPFRKAGSSLKDQTSSTTKAAPRHTSLFGSNSNGPSRDVKENKAPTSSPIPGLSPSGDQCIIQREKVKSVEHDREDAGAQASAPKFSKRKARGWEFEEHSRRVDGDLTKRWRDTSPPYNQASRSIIKEDIPSTLIRYDPQTTPTKTPHTWSSAVTPFHDNDYDIDAAFGSVIESSQTQPLLSPGRPFASSLQAHASLSQASDGGIVRSSQSPSPLKYSQQSTAMVIEPTFSVTPPKASIYPSPSKIGIDVTETPVARRRRAPEPGTVSLFGVRGDGVGSPLEVSLDTESPSTRALHSGVKLIRRPGRYSILPLVDDMVPSTSPHTLDSKKIQYSPVLTRTQTPSVPSIAHVDHPPSQTLTLELGGSSENVKNGANEPGPFWETQPLLDFDSDEPIPPSTSPPASPSPVPRISLPPTNTSPGTIYAELANTSGSETEPDSPTPFLPSTRYNTSSIDPDKTIVTFTSTRQKRAAASGPMGSNLQSRHLDATDSTTDSGEREGEDADKTMVNHHGRVLGHPTSLRGKVKEGEIRDVTLDLDGLSPFKQDKTYPAAHKQILRLYESGTTIIDGEDSADPSVNHHTMPLEETQDDQTYTQLWPGTSLPAGWNAFETPKKPRWQPRVRFPNGSQPNSCRGGITFVGSGDDYKDLVWDGSASDDVFGPEVTPGTLQREKPEEVKAFEALPSPYDGMFRGHREGESEDDSDV